MQDNRVDFVIQDLKQQVSNLSEERATNFALAAQFKLENEALKQENEALSMERDALMTENANLKKNREQRRKQQNSPNSKPKL